MHVFSWIRHRSRHWYSRKYMEEKSKKNVGKGEKFPFLSEPGHVISIVGAGGKTSLLYDLAQRFVDNGLRTVVLTTTKIYQPQAFCESIEACRANWERGCYAVCGTVISREKLGCPSKEVLKQILLEAQAVLVEADGAAGKACKVPASHEPVILPESDIVIGVLGADVLGCTIEESCHRPHAVAAFLGREVDHRLTEADLAEIFLSEQGLYKNVGCRSYYMVLNKCDNEEREQAGERIRQQLWQKGKGEAILTCFREGADK